MIVLIGIAYAVIDTPGYEPAKGQTPREISAQSHMVSSGEFDMYQFVLDSEEDYDNCLLFYTNHQEVHVYSSGKLIYSREKSDSPFGHTTGDIWNQVEIPNGATVITVMITPVYSKIIQRNFQFYLGNYMVMNQFIIHESFLNLLVCFMIILVGSCAIIFWLFSRRRDRPMDEVLYLGILIELLGFWSLGENLFVVYIGQNRAAASYFSHTCLMLAGVPFVLFFRKFLHLHDKYIYRIVTGYCLIQMFVCQILQFFNIYDLKETTIFTHVMIVLCFGYVIGGIGLNLIRGRHTRKTIINLVGILILGMSTGMDMITYYLDREHANQIGKFGLLLFTVLLGIETVRQAQKYLDELEQSWEGDSSTDESEDNNQAEVGFPEAEEDFKTIKNLSIELPDDIDSRLLAMGLKVIDQQTVKEKDGTKNAFTFGKADFKNGLSTANQYGESDLDGDLRIQVVKQNEDGTATCTFYQKHYTK